MTPDDAPSAGPSDASAATPADPAAGPAPPSPAPAPPASPPSPGAEEPTKEPGLLERLPWWTVPAILVGVPLLFALVAQAVPSFYEEVVWRYYWGPIKADAMNCQYLSSASPDRCASAFSPGVLAESGYNIVNTLTWAALLFVCIAGIAQMLTVFRTPMDAKLIVAATAWVIVGSIVHVLEDTGLFAGWLQYFFITPPIYLLFGAFGVGSFLVGQWMRSVAARSDLHAALRVLWLVHVVAVLVWLGLWLKDWPQITRYINPVWVALFAVVNFWAARAVVLRQGRVDPSLLTLVLSLGTYLMALMYVYGYIQDPWPDSSGAVHGPDEGMPSSFLIAPALALAVTGLVFLAARALVRRGKSKAAAYLVPINLLLVFAQMVDAFATALGIDLHGYTEKHVLSAGVIDVFRDFAVNVGWEFGARYPTFLAFASVKLAVSLLVVWAIDIHGAEDARQHPTLIGLVKFAIIMVGMGPGVRDFVRLSLGV
jgi:uncharacterized membrane protein